MLARSSFVLFSILICSFLTGCERDNDLAFPDKFEVQPEEFCIEESPFETPHVVEHVAFEGIDYQFAYTNYNYQIPVKYLIDNISAQVYVPEQFYSPNILKSLIDPADGGTSLLTSKQVNRLKSKAVELNNRSMFLKYEKDGELIEGEIEAGNVISGLDLKPGLNEISVIVRTDILVPFSGIECSLDSNLRESISLHDTGEVNETTEAAINAIESTSRTLSYEIVYHFSIYRDGIQGIETFTQGSALGQFTDGDMQGINVSISGDYLAVGVPNEDSLSEGMGVYTALDYQNNSDSSIVNDSSKNSGAVYVYERDRTGAWQFAWMLKAPNGGEGDLFGHSISFDGSWLAVSAPGEDSGSEGVISIDSSEGVNDVQFTQKVITSGQNNLGPDSGAVYLFNRDSEGDWGLYSYIKPQNNVRSDDAFNIGFGDQVVVKAMASNAYKLAVGAPFEDSDNGSFGSASVPDSGAVYVYEKTQSEALVRYKGVIKAPLPKRGDRFGASVDISADGSIYVGAPYEDSGDREIIDFRSTVDYIHSSASENSGAVFVYSELLELFSIIKPTNADPGDLFGSKISVSGNRLAVSSPLEDNASVGFNRDMDSNASQDTGAVYLFMRNNENDRFSQELYVKPPVNEALSRFGNDLSLTDNKLVVAHSQFDNSAGIDAGSFYIYILENSVNAWQLAYAHTQEASMSLGGSIGFNKDTVVASSENNETPFITLR